MLAEIFILRLEIMLRALKEDERAKNYRFVPLPTTCSPTFREKQASIGNRTVDG
jgi:hypothetical protein